MNPIAIVASIAGILGLLIGSSCAVYVTANHYKEIIADEHSQQAEAAATQARIVMDEVEKNGILENQLRSEYHANQIKVAVLDGELDGVRRMHRACAKAAADSNSSTGTSGGVAAPAGNWLLPGELEEADRKVQRADDDYDAAERADARLADELTERLRFLQKWAVNGSSEIRPQAPQPASRE